MKADGSVGGQWQDTFSGGGIGIHVSIDCLNVSGNEAVVGGMITHGDDGGGDLTGERAVAAVVDNGTSSNDPPDEISFSVFPFGDDQSACQQLTVDDFRGVGFMFTLANGQVTVRS